MEQQFLMKPIFNKVNQYVILDLSNVLIRAESVSEPEFVFTTLISMLSRYRKLYPHRSFVFALEGTGSKQRAKILPEYKLNRNNPERDAPIVSDMVIKLLQLTNSTIVIAPEGEADDAIAAFIKQQARGLIVTIISEDHDLWQLLGPNVTILTRSSEITSEACLRKLGVVPNNVTMMKALLGDPSDNIPRGVPRIKKSVLLELANLAENPEEINNVLASPKWTYPKLTDRIVACTKAIKRNFSVVQLHRDIKIQVQEYSANIEQLTEFIKEISNKEYSSNDIRILAGTKNT